MPLGTASLVDTRSGADLDEVAIFERLGQGRLEPPAWVAMPAAVAAGAEPLIAVHGILRRAEEQARLFAACAAALGRPVVAPLFSAETFPRYQRAVHRDRADLALLGLLDALAAELGLATRRFALFGFSGGAQFAHRFAWLYPHRVTHLSLAAAGWYTFPDDAPFPYGLGPAAKRRLDFGRHCRANLRDFLALPIDVFVGAADNAVDENTRSGPAIDSQQGRNRLSRAERWTMALRLRALSLDIAPRITLRILDGCGHDFRQCVELGGLDGLVLPPPNEGDQVSTYPAYAAVPATGEPCQPSCP